MPLRDHFRSPLDDKQSWDGLHGGWPMVIVQHLIKVLPERFFALPSVHLASSYEVDIGTFRDLELDSLEDDFPEGGVAIAAYAPPKPTVSLEPELPNQDVYEIRIYDSRRNRRLVAAIEIVSPSNKDRSESRLSFVSKGARLLEKGICLTIVDLVSTMDFNLYSELLDSVRVIDPALEFETPPMYAATLRTRFENSRKMLDNWYYPLVVGQPLPNLPIWLTESFAVSLDLEASYEETCRTLRIR